MAAAARAEAPKAVMAHRVLHAAQDRLLRLRRDSSMVSPAKFSSSSRIRRSCAWKRFNAVARARGGCVRRRSWLRSGGAGKLWPSCPRARGRPLAHRRGTGRIRDRARGAPLHLRRHGFRMAGRRPLARWALRRECEGRVLPHGPCRRRSCGGADSRRRALPRGGNARRQRPPRSRRGGGSFPASRPRRRHGGRRDPDRARNHLIYPGHDAWTERDHRPECLAKHRKEIGAGAFIGSNSALVASITIGDGAYVASGSVITRDVAPDALAIARERQVEKPGFAARLWARLTGRR